MATVDWDLEIDDEDSRTEIHKRHGGSESRGISAPGRASGRNNIMLWWQPKRGELFGYSDGWTEDASAFYFSGTGQHEDQRFEAPNSENGRVRDHVSNGDHIRLLRYVSKNKVQYVGELRLDPGDPWRWVDGLDAKLRMRRMIQFRFLPLHDMDVPEADRARPRIATSPEEEAPPNPLPPPRATDIEALQTKGFKRLVTAREVLAQRAEAELVHDFRGWLLAQYGLGATGLRIPYKAEGRNLRADLFITEPRVLVEAKATAARESIRMAIGQLLDYARWVSPTPHMCVLTPERPAKDMGDLLDSLGIACAWRVGVGRFTIHPDSVVHSEGAPDEATSL